MITVFENFNNNVVKPPDLNSVSDEFWKMVDIADWNAVIKGYSEKINKYLTRKIQKNFYYLIFYRIFVS